MKTFYRKLLIGAAITFVAFLILYQVGIAKHLSVANIQSWGAAMQLHVQSNYMGAVITFLFICVALIALTLPITGPMGVVGGFLFGLWPGVFYSMLAIFIGTTISFLVVRYALSHIVQDQYREKLNDFNRRVRKYGYSYLISLQLLTVVPYFVINTLAALAGISLPKFLLTTLIGSLPIMLIYNFAGKQLYMIQTWRDILSLNMLALLLVLAFLALLPMLMRKMKFAGMGEPEDPMEDDENISPWM